MSRIQMACRAGRSQRSSRPSAGSAVVWLRPVARRAGVSATSTCRRQAPTRRAVVVGVDSRTDIARWATPASTKAAATSGSRHEVASATVRSDGSCSPGTRAADARGACGPGASPAAVVRRPVAALRASGPPRRPRRAARPAGPRSGARVPRAAARRGAPRRSLRDTGGRPAGSRSGASGAARPAAGPPERSSRPARRAGRRHESGGRGTRADPESPAPSREARRRSNAWICWVTGWSAGRRARRRRAGPRWTPRCTRSSTSGEASRSAGGAASCGSGVGVVARGRVGPSAWRKTTLRSSPSCVGASVQAPMSPTRRSSSSAGPSFSTIFECCT